MTVLFPTSPSAGVRELEAPQYKSEAPIIGGWSPQQGPGSEPLVRGSGGEAPLKLKQRLLLLSLCVFNC